jgi:hypothetical protein
MVNSRRVAHEALGYEFDNSRTRLMPPAQSRLKARTTEPVPTRKALNTREKKNRLRLAVLGPSRHGNAPRHLTFYQTAASDVGGTFIPRRRGDPLHLRAMDALHRHQYCRNEIKRRL